MPKPTKCGKLEFVIAKSRATPDNDINSVEVIMEKQEILERAKKYIAEEKDERFRKKSKTLSPKKTTRNWKTVFTRRLSSEPAAFAE